MHLQSKKLLGFTLIEMLVVLSVIGILIAGATVSLGSNAKNARDSRRKVDIEQIRAALELYRTDQPNGNYPTVLTSLAPTYIAAVPTDPLTAASYSYVPLPAAPVACNNTTVFCTSYTVTATIERTGLTYTMSPNSVAY